MGGFWFLGGREIIVGGRFDSYGGDTAGAAVTLNNTNIRGHVRNCNGNTYTLPAIATGLYGAEVAFFCNPSGTASTINANGGASTIVLPGGTLASSYTVAPGRFASLRLIGGFWVVTTN